MTTISMVSGELDHLLRFVEQVLQPEEAVIEQLRVQLVNAYESIYLNGRHYSYGFVSRTNEERTMRRLQAICGNEVDVLNRYFALDFDQCVDDWDAAAACLSTVLQPKLCANVAVRQTLLHQWWNVCTPELVLNEWRESRPRTCALLSDDVATLRRTLTDDAAELMRLFEAALSGVVVEQPLVMHVRVPCSTVEQVFVVLAALNTHLTPAQTWYALMIAYLARRVDSALPVFRKTKVPPLPDSTIDWLFDYYAYLDDPDHTDCALRRLSEHWRRGYSSRRAVSKTSPSSFFSDFASFHKCVESEVLHRTPPTTASSAAASTSQPDAPELLVQVADLTPHKERRSPSPPTLEH